MTETADRPLDEMHQAPMALIKSVTRQLVAACAAPGETGLQRAARLTGYSLGAVSRWQGENYPDTIPLAAVCALEMITGRPVFARALAALTGHRLVCLADEGEAAAHDFTGDMVSQAGSAAAVTARFAEALDDRVVSPAEARRIFNAIGDHETHLDGIKRRLAACMEGAS